VLKTFKVNELPLPYDLLISNTKRLFGRAFDGSNWPLNTAGTSQGGGPVSGMGAATPTTNTGDAISGQHRGFFGGK